jgi:hypothetical protein
MAGYPRYQPGVRSRLTVNGIVDSVPPWSSTSAAVAGIPRSPENVTVTWQELPAPDGAPEVAFPVLLGAKAVAVAALGGVVSSR